MVVTKVRVVTRMSVAVVVVVVIMARIYAMGIAIVGRLSDMRMGGCRGWRAGVRYGGTGYPTYIHSFVSFPLFIV